MNKLKQFGSNLRGTFWFVPTLIVALSIVLAVGLIEADSSGSRAWMADWPRLLGAGAAGARGVLATIAGSMMTVVGVTFSMTLMTLALASSQYTSRILRNFMRDRVTQVVLGIFAGGFTYCLLVLRTIRGGDEGGFVPSLSVAISVVLAIGQTFASLVAESFDQIRGSAMGNGAIMLRVLGALQTIASQTPSPGRRRALQEQVECIAELAERTTASPHDRIRFENRLARVREAIETAPVRSATVPPTKTQL
jgi:uncharacterized membrane protein